MDTHIKKIKTLAGREVRIIIFDDNWLEDAAVEQLKKTMELDGMLQGIGMPDLHPGKGQPIGAAFVTRNSVYPHLVGSDIGCGMGLWDLDIPVRKIKLDKWDKQLVGLDELWDGCPEERLHQKGVSASSTFGWSENAKLGTIGGGNHFAELQKVDSIFDPVAFKQSGLSHQSVKLLVHSGSRGLGQKILREYVDDFGSKAISMNDQPELGSHYIQQHNYAIRWAEVNRDVIAERFCKQLKAQRRPVLDVAHNRVDPLPEQYAKAMGLLATKGLSTKESSVDSNKKYWIHRKGASPTDQGLVMIPGSRGSLSYLVKPCVSNINNLAQGGFSLAHGAGRKWKRADARGRLENHYKVKDLEKTAMGSRVICKQRDLLYEEAPQAYKNISHVISDLVSAGLVDIVATFKPLLTYKTRRV